MLDNGIPELDRKIAILTGTSCSYDINMAPQCKDDRPESEIDLHFDITDSSHDRSQPKSSTPELTSIREPIRKQQTVLHATRHSTPKATTWPEQMIRRPANPIKVDDIQVVKHSAVQDKPIEKKPSQSNRERDRVIVRNRPSKHVDLHTLEHLKPLPMPLSEYFKRNRPEIYINAEQRVMYLKRKSELRKFMSASRVLNSFQNFKLSTKNAQRSKHSRSRTEPDFKDYMVRSPDHCVKYKITEREMRRLTARTYNRLPEVKLQRKEEVSNHMRVQNYKNKQEFSRKLLLNRRRGIINYPLNMPTPQAKRYPDSQDNSLTNESENSVDTLRSDPYY